MTQPVTSFLSAERHRLETHNEDHLQKEEIQDGVSELGLYPFYPSQLKRPREAEMGAGARGKGENDKIYRGGSSHCSFILLFTNEGERNVI